ncbi:hypothetical protein NQU36_27775, partial [Escherichia coli]|uniref:hypothetical protein n=1 Tax=Escherichia coli TaxID=562 RepID=UPI0021197F4F
APVDLCSLREERELLVLVEAHASAPEEWGEGRQLLGVRLSLRELSLMRRVLREDLVEELWDVEVLHVPEPVRAEGSGHRGLR